MNNQTDKRDNGKLPLTQVPSEIIYNIAAVRQFGMTKYSKEPTWRNVEVERYRDAMYRHWLAYVEDPYGLDEESGLPHLYHVAWNCATLCEMEKGKYNEQQVLDLTKLKSVSFKSISMEEMAQATEKLKEAIENQPLNATVDADGFDWKKGDYVEEKNK